MSEDNNELPIECQSFDEEFATVFDYARMYRSLGLQVVPAMSPSSGKNWKRPALPSWKEFTHKLSSDEQFEQWFKGHPNLTNIGLLTGPCSKNLFIIDLDTHKNPHAMIWWEGIHADHNMGIMSETPTQRTGGGGLQMLFFAPDGWIPPTIKTSIGVDIRGVGGFAVVAPSKHELKGSEYAWLPGQEPYTLPIAVSKMWMCQAVDELAAKFGGHVATSSGERIRTETPVHQTDEWGHLTDGREDKMYRMIFREVLQLYRDCPIIPTEGEQSKVMSACFERYVDSVETRIREIGTPKHMLLEREGRGITIFRQKWRAAIRQWDDKIANEASRPWVHEETAREKYKNEESDFESSDPDAPPPDIFDLWSFNDLKNQPPAVFIWEGMFVEGGSHYFASEPGVGKSFLGMGIAIAIATGMKSFLGRQVNKHGLVIYVTTEGLYDHYKRANAFAKHYGVEIDDLPSYFVIPNAMNLMQERDRSKLLRTIAYATKRNNAPPVLVVFDTVSRLIPGANENDVKDMSLFVAAKGAVKEAFKTTDLSMHHVSRSGSGNMRGSTSLEGEADGIFTIQREKGQELTTMTAAKIKGAIDGWVQEFLLKTVDVDAFSTSLVPVEIKQASSAGSSDGFGGKQETGSQIVEGRKWPTRDICEKIVRAIQAAADKKEPWLNSERARDYGRYAAARIKHMFGVDEDTANHMISVWLTTDVLEVYTYDSRNHKKGLKIKNGL